MSKFDLRDISERLTGSADTEAVVFEFLGYLQSLHADWRASLAFYEVSRDALENVYERQGSKLARRDISVPVDQLPARLVRKFFHPSAFFNQGNRRSIISQWLRTSPVYEPEPLESTSLRPLVPVANWQSCACISLMDREDVLAMLVIASEKRNAIPSKAIDEILPAKSIAALALAQHLQRGRAPQQNGGEDVRAATAEFQDKIRELSTHASELEADNQLKNQRLEALSREIELLDKNSSEYKGELEGVRETISALEEQTAVAAEHLSEAYTQLTTAQHVAVELDRTVHFMRAVCHMLSVQHDATGFTQSMVEWLAKQFGVERVSLMCVEEGGETLTIVAHCGLDNAVAARAKVRIGQGIAGWVAQHRKPLFVRVPEEVPAIPRTVKESYNSDSFICVPLLYSEQLCGVLSLSNKSEGEPFEGIDLDRASMAASVLAVVLAGQPVFEDEASHEDAPVFDPAKGSAVA